MSIYVGGTVSRAAERLKALTPEGADAQYAWPSLAEIRKITVPDTDRERFECWSAVGAGRDARLIKTRDLPMQVREHLPPSVGNSYAVTAHFSLCHALGQIDDWEKRNLMVAIPPTFTAVRTIGDVPVVKWPGLLAEIGCDHDYSEVERRNCYRSARCRKCDHHWACDSGD